MRIVLGIGNPGREYAGTRHNVGFMVVDALAERMAAGPFRSRFEALVAETSFGAERLLLLKPQTYVNESGRAARAAVDWYDAAPQDMMVVVDDFQLPLGVLRVRRGGSSGGHRGMESIVQHLGTEAFPRLRVGIGREGGPRDRDYVLSPFDPSEREAAAAAVEKGADAVEVWLREDIERCMNAFNARPRAKDSEDGKEESV